MEIFVFGLLPFFLAIGIPIVLSVIGVAMERRHEEDLQRREAASASFSVSSLKTLPAGHKVHATQLVSGNAVMGTGYLKQLFASFRQLVGGEVISYQRVLGAARREAQLRMIEEARSQGATSIINARFETSDVGGGKPFAEVMCYGTMVQSSIND